MSSFQNFQLRDLQNQSKLAHQLIDLFNEYLILIYQFAQNSPEKYSPPLYRSHPSPLQLLLNTQEKKETDKTPSSYPSFNLA